MKIEIVAEGRKLEGNELLSLPMGVLPSFGLNIRTLAIRSKVIVYNLRYLFISWRVNVDKSRSAKVLF